MEEAAAKEEDFQGSTLHQCCSMGQPKVIQNSNREGTRLSLVSILHAAPLEERLRQLRENDAGQRALVSRLLHMSPGFPRYQKPP